MPKPKPKSDLPRFLLNTEQACSLLSCSPDTLERFRSKPEYGWIAGCHFTQLTPGGDYRYNYDLLIDWAANRHDPAAHQVAIENFRASLLSSAPRKRAKRLVEPALGHN